MPERSRKPWWAAALLGGVGMGLALAASLGLGTAARGQEQVPIATSSLVQQQKTIAEWQVRMENKVDQALRDIGETKERVARMEGRLEHSK